MGVDRDRVCELYAAGPVEAGSGSGYRLSDRLVLTARHVIAPALAGPGGQLLVRPVGVTVWLPARVEWADVAADVALIGIEDEHWQAPGRESVLRWGELAGSDPVPCAAVGFPWASARPDRMRDTAHLYGQLAPLGQLKQGRLDFDVASASPSAREGGSPWAGMSGAGVIADNRLVAVVTVDPALYQDRLVAVPVGRLLTDEGFRAQLAGHGVRAEAVPVGAWYLQLPGGQAVSLAPAYQPVSRRFRPAPSTLLRPEHGLVPFVGRQAVLDQISGWCQGPPGTPVLLVLGGGGSGKTRLGREACVQMLATGWDAGIADDQRRDGEARPRLERRTLLVVDDADLRTGLISALVEYLRWDEAGPRVGLLLLARAAGAWWDRLVRQQELDDSYTAVDLDRHVVPLADRAEHFRRASAAFAAYGGRGAQSAVPPPIAELNDPAYAEPLLIHIAALLRTVDMSATPAPTGPDRDRAPGEDITAAQPGAPVRQQLLRALCERERRRWYDLGAGSHLFFNPDLPVADQVVALATLTAVGDQASAKPLLAALPNQAEVTRIGAEALAAWAHRLYAGPGYWNPLRPDLLAEQHLADTPQLPALATSAAQLAAGQRWEAGLLTQLLSELTRGAPNQPAVGAALDELLAAALPRIVDLAVTTGHAELADLASLALQLAPQPRLAVPLVGQMPEHSVRLAALAATLISQQVTQNRADARGGEQNAASRLAASLNNLSNRLAELGRREEALAAIQEAAGIYRELAAARVPWYALRRRLMQLTVRPARATTLTNLSLRLGELGRREEALAASQEAVTICRELAAGRVLAVALPDAFRPGRVLAAGLPGAFRPALAQSLTSLSVRLAGLGRAEEALAAGQEAASIYRELAAARPDAFRPALADSLNNLSADLGELGRREEALAAIQEAVTIRRELAAARPDAFRPALADSLNNLANRLAGLGRAEEALAAGQEAAETYRELAAARPDAFRPALAGSLTNLAVHLGGLGRAEEALAVGQEAAETCRELAAARPDAFRPALADSLTNLSADLGELGRREEALAAGQEAVTIRRELAAARPDAFRPDLASSLTILANRLRELGRWEEALAASQEAVTIYRELAAARPDAFRPDLAASLTNLALCLRELGRWEEALAASQEAVGTYRELAAARPDAFRPDLALSLNNLAFLLGDVGRREEGLAVGQEAVTIRRELAAARPDAFRPDLADSLTNLANLLVGLGRAEEALAASQEAVGTYRELAAGRPDALRPDLAGSLTNLAVLLVGLGRAEEALAASQEAVGTYRELAAGRPDALRPDLALSLTNLALLLVGLGRAEEALAASQEAAGTYQELAAGRPDALRPDLALSLNNLAFLLVGLGRAEEALAASQEAAGIYRELAAGRPDAFRPDLAMSMTSLALCLGELGRAGEALAASQEAVTIRRELAAARPDAFRPDLAGSLTNLANLLADLGRREEALAASQEAVTIHRELAAARPDAFRPDLAGSLTNLAVLLADLGRREEALAASQEAVTIHRELAARRPDAYSPELEQSLQVVAWLEHGEDLSDESPQEPRT